MIADRKIADCKYRRALGRKFKNQQSLIGNHQFPQCGISIMRRTGSFEPGMVRIGGGSVEMSS